VDGLVVDVIHEILAGQRCGEECHGNAQKDVRDIRKRFQSVPRGCPLRDHRCAAASGAVGQVEAVDRKIRAREKCPDGRAQQQRPGDAVDHQEYVECLFAEDVARFAAVFVGHGLDDEHQQDRHPYIERAAERRGVEERERGEECAAEGHERRESEFPFAAQRVDQHVTFLFGLADVVEQPLSALHEEQEDQQRPQQGDDQPPIVLQEC
jgi:hypothetical protein